MNQCRFPAGKTYRDMSYYRERWGGQPSRINQGEESMASLSRQLAQWIVGLRYEDLPPEVIDRAKGVTLQALSSVLIGKQAGKLMTDEESGVRNGATIMVNGSKVTKGGAAFANSEMAFAGGKWDTF